MIRKLFQYERKLLGRWTRLGRKESNWKTDMANTDHCGICAIHELKQYPLTQTVSETDTLEYYLVMAEMGNTSNVENLQLK
jgi:hypothetical protein